MGNFQQGLAKFNQATELLRLEGEGPQMLSVDVLDAHTVLLSAFKESDGVQTAVTTSQETKVTSETVANDNDGSDTTAAFTTDFSPLVPGSFSVAAGAFPAMADTLANGNLYLTAVGPKLLASGGTFATMAAEFITVKVGGLGVESVADQEQTFTFGTQATIGAAVTALNAGTVGLLAVAQGAQDVDLHCSGLGPTAYITVVDCSPGLTTKLGISPGTSTALVGTVKYATGVLSMETQGFYDSAAALTGTVAGPWNLAPADTLVVDVDDAGDATATFDAGAATATGSGGSFATLSNETFICTVSGYDAVTVTMATENTQILAIAKINLQLKGAHCETVDANNVKIIADKIGTGTTVILATVAAGITAKLGLSAGTSTGTGDVADIDAVTFAEAKTVIEADLAASSDGVTVTATADGKLVVTSNTTGADSELKVNASSSAELKFGLSTTEVNGAVSGAPNSAEVNYKYTAALAANSNTLLKVPNLKLGDTLVLKALGLSGASRVNVKVLPLG